MVSKDTRKASLNPTWSTSLPLELLVMDLMGPFKVATYGGCCFLLTLRDVLTTYGEVHLLKNKSDAACTIIESISRLENQTNLKVKYICSDGGGEFLNTELTQWLRSNGIIHIVTMPNTPQNNGTA